MHEIAAVSKSEGNVIPVPPPYNGSNVRRRTSVNLTHAERKHLNVKVLSLDKRECPPSENAPVPPDGGYGYVIVFAAFMSTVIVEGIIYSFGGLKNSIYEDLQRQTISGGPVFDQATVAWVGSTLTGFYFVMGPFVSAAANKFGFRIVAVVGSVIASTGFIITWYLNLDGANMTYLVIFYGFIGGVGLSCILLPTVVTVGLYFEKKRALAIGITSCGSGVGGFIFPPIIAFMTSRWHWQGAILGLGFIVLFCGLLGLLYKPLKTSVTPNIDEETNKQQKQSGTNSTKSFGTGNRVSGLPVFGRLVNFILHSNEVKPPELVSFTVNKPMQSDGSNLDHLNGTRAPVIILQHVDDSVVNSSGAKQSHGEPSPQSEYSKTTFCSRVMFSVCKAINTLVDLSLIQSPSFLVLGFSSLIGMLGLVVPFVYLMDQVKYVLSVGESGPEKNMLTLLISLIGAANTAGQIIFGWLADRQFINVLMLNNAAVTIMGISVGVVPFLREYYQFVIFSFVFGSCFACFQVLRPILVVKFLGLDKLTNGIGLILLFLGIGGTVATPVAGTFATLEGTTTNFSIAFYFAGGCLLLSACICYPLSIINNWETKENIERKLSSPIHVNSHISHL